MGGVECSHMNKAVWVALIVVVFASSVVVVPAISKWGAKSGNETQLFDLDELRDPKNLKYKVISEETLVVDGEAVRRVDVQFLSLEWRGKRWTHRAIIFYPEGCQTALGAIVTGGIGHRGQEWFVEEFGLKASAETGVPVLLLGGVPNVQFGIEDEDELMGYCMSKAFETKDPTWCLLYPMATAYMRAMTLLQELAPSHPTSFVLSGGCKRAWAAWVAAIYDDRVVGLVVRSFNTANVTALAERHLRLYGEYVGSLATLNKYGVVDAVEENRWYLDVYEPIRHFDEVCSRLDVLVLTGSADRLFPVGMEKTYLDAYGGEIWFEITPNTTHTGLHSSFRAVASWKAFLLHIVLGAGLPKLSAQVQASEGTVYVSLSVEPQDCQVVDVRVWSCVADDEVGLISTNWRPTDAIQEGELWLAELPLQGPVMGVYVEASFTIGGVTGFVSTAMETVES